MMTISSTMYLLPHPRLCQFFTTVLVVNTVIAVLLNPKIKWRTKHSSRLSSPYGSSQGSIQVSVHIPVQVSDLMTTDHLCINLNRSRRIFSCVITHHMQLQTPKYNCLEMLICMPHTTDDCDCTWRCSPPQASVITMPFYHEPTSTNHCLWWYNSYWPAGNRSWGSWWWFFGDVPYDDHFFCIQRQITRVRKELRDRQQTTENNRMSNKLKPTTAITTAAIPSFILTNTDLGNVAFSKQLLWYDPHVNHDSSCDSFWVSQLNSNCFQPSPPRNHTMTNNLCHCWWCTHHLIKQDLSFHRPSIIIIKTNLRTKRRSVRPAIGRYHLQLQLSTPFQHQTDVPPTGLSSSLYLLPLYHQLTVTFKL